MVLVHILAPKPSSKVIVAVGFDPEEFFVLANTAEIANPWAGLFGLPLACVIPHLVAKVFQFGARVGFTPESESSLVGTRTVLGKFRNSFFNW